MDKTQLKEIIKKFIKKLDEKKYSYTAVYLFGSHAKDNANEHSDIDIAVFKKNLNNWWKEQVKLGHLSIAVDTRIEPKVFDKNELNKPKDPLVREIKEYGKKVA